METDNIIVLNDQLGREIEFEVLDLIGYAGRQYVLLLPVEDSDGSVVILQVQELDDETSEYFAVEDEATLDAVFNLFREKNKEEFDFAD